MQVLPGESGLAGAGVRAADLLGLPVRVRGIQLGRPVDLLLDPGRRRLLGLDVLCGDDRRRFLPYATAIVAANELRVPTALVLVDEEDAGFYRERTVRFTSLRGVPVARGKQALGRLHDLVVDAGGRVSALVLDSGNGAAEVPCTGELQVGGGIFRC
jgi:hypothetical protein